MGGIVYTDFEIIADFTWPFDEHLNIILIGDHIDASIKNELTDAFTLSRESFAKAAKTKLNQPRFITVNTSELFRGTLTPFELDANVLYLDPESSVSIINILLGNTKNMDSLDLMLWNKYIVDINWDRFVFDVANCDNDLLQDLLMHLDNNLAEFNYLIMGNLLGICVFTENKE